MAIKDFFNRFQKREIKPAGTVAKLIMPDDWHTIIGNGYTTLANNPEIMAGCRRIAELVSSMTVYLMSNTEKGDKRIINELSRKIDINPNPYMTRSTFMDAIVMNLLLYGKGNAVVLPHTHGGFIQSLEPIEAGRVGFIPKDRGYSVTIDGKEHRSDSVLHFVHNPDPYYLWLGKGLTTTLESVARNLMQADATTKAFLSSKWKPSIIIKVDALTDEFASKSGRKKLLEEYIETSEIGEPFVIPAEQFAVEQIKPLSLSDLAINDVITLDKKTVAALLGVPAFVLGVGEYKPDEWNAFINNTIRPIAREIEQELTKKLILSDKWYFKFNIGSLYSYDLQAIGSIYGDGVRLGAVTRNEYRDKLGMEYKDGLDELLMLENFIPADKLGDQKKLN